MTPETIITALSLSPHPEGGWYRETWRSADTTGGRAAGTAIYFLLSAGERSHWHRVDADETWHHYAGGPLALRIAPTPDGPAIPQVLSDRLHQGLPQITVPKGAWQAAVPLGAWTLAGCTVSPGFQFDGFDLAPPGFDIPGPPTILRGLPDRHRDQAAALFWDAFRGKLAPFLGPRDKALRFIAGALCPRFALSALGQDGALLGLAGFKTETGGLLGGGLADLARIYGWPGAAWRGPALSLFERPLDPELLLMDGIFVAATARGQGIGTTLLNAVMNEAARLGKRAVRLDVIDENPRARALYERQGFVAGARTRTGPLGAVMGFSGVTTMERPVPRSS